MVVNFNPNQSKKQTAAEKEAAKKIAHEKYLEMTRLSTPELKELDKEITEAGGTEKYLILKEAIRIDEKGNWSILQHDDGSMPYTELSVQLEQLNKYKSWIQNKEDEEIKNTTGIDVRAARIKKIFSTLKDLTLFLKVSE